MKILVTGANGFVGRNLVSTLENIRDGKDKTTKVTTDIEIFKYDIGTSAENFEKYCSECDFVFNLVGVHRPKDNSEFMEGNFGFLSELLKTLQKHNNNCPVMFSSSIQAECNNPYGESKRAAENAVFAYSEKTGARVCVYRFTNLFGKWSRPNYNSVVATFCYNIAHGLPIEISDRNFKINLLYIDDVIAELLNCLTGDELRRGKFCCVDLCNMVTLGELSDMIYSFKKSRETKRLPDMTDGSFSKKLYSTYLSFLPENEFSYPLKMNVDTRGSFSEILKTDDRGQISVNISKPGIVKGQHWHHTKNEKFLVVSGKGVIRFRRIDSDKVIEYFVSGEKLEIVDIPTGYTHNIENLGNTDMVTFMWCNECFNPDRPDTYLLPVSVNEIKKNKKSVLVLGGAGMAGHIIATYFRDNGYNVTIFDMEEVVGFKCIKGSAFNTGLLKEIIGVNQYTAVINCIALLNKACDTQRASAIFLNSYLPHFLCEILSDSKAKLIQISSDCVFSGTDAPYKEADIPDAIDNYGRTKADGEINNQKDLLIRTSIIGPDLNSKKASLVNWFFEQFGEISGYSKVMWSGVSTITLAKAIKAAVECDLSGIYHLVNNEFISKYDLLLLFNKYFRNSQLFVKNESLKSSDKVLINTRTDFEFTVPSYECMVKDIAEWIKNHRDLYPHYGSVAYET